MQEQIDYHDLHGDRLQRLRGLPPRRRRGFRSPPSSTATSVVLYVWYDNEFGYSCQVMRVMQEMSGIKYPSLPVGEASDGTY